MKVERDLDKIINILYDNNILLFKTIPATDLTVFGEKKYGLKLNNNEIVFIISILCDDGFIKIEKSDDIKPVAYSLTTKGIRLKQSGGFVRNLIIDKIKQGLIIIASIVTVLVGVLTTYDLVNKFSSTPREIPSSKNDYTTKKQPTNNPYINIEINNTNDKTTRTTTDNDTVDN